MDIIFAALLVSKTVLPAIDRETLDLQARAEAMRPAAAPKAPARPRPAQQRRTASLGPLDLDTMTTICRTASTHAHPVAFVQRLATAYELSATQAQSLRFSCADYLSARADTLRILRTHD